MQQLLKRVRWTIKAHDLARPGTGVVVAVSGGSDSVALAHLLCSLDRAGELRVLGLAHFNHQLRPAADEDEQFCARVAQSLARPFLADREQVAERAKAERRSLEDAAHRARHEFFQRASRHFGAYVVALAHTRDDQAETFLLRLLRGAGARGLAAMHPRHGTIIRPLLECRRADLRAYLDSQQIAFVCDESNEDLTIPRNRIRAELLPLLERRFNPSIVDVLADEAEIAREEWRWMTRAANEISPRVCRREGESWRIDVQALSSLSVALARLIVQGAMTEAARGRPVSFAHVEDALRLAREGGALDRPGHRMERLGGEVVLTNMKTRKANLFEYPLSVPGEVELVEAGYVVSAETAATAAATGAILGNAKVGMARLDRCSGSLTVRNRRSGDRFRPLGVGGRKKLQDFFVDRKVPRERRDDVPLVVDKADRIVWVAGHSIDDEFRVTDPAQAVLILRLRQV